VAFRAQLMRASRRLFLEGTVGYPPFESRPWLDAFGRALIDEFGKDRGEALAARYGGAFAPGYMFDITPPQAVGQVGLIEQVLANGEIAVSVEPRPDSDGYTWGRVISRGEIMLSRLVDVLQNLGAVVIDERSHKVIPTGPAGDTTIWVYALRLVGEGLGGRRDLVQEAFLSVWRGEIEDDGLNRLVARAGLSAREIIILRGIAKYLRQAEIAFSERHIEQTLVQHSAIAFQLVNLFAARFDPGRRDRSEAERLEAAIESGIRAVEGLAEDQILQGFLTLVRAIVRTNYFRLGDDGSPRQWLAFKLLPARVALLPDPRPRYEIFVYSARMEGVHMRYGQISRGGIRLSDREDFRREVAGLVHTQDAKNAVIVPAGAKGAFVAKCLAAVGGAEQRLAETVACYKMFLAGLLDLTDNVVGGKVVPPPRVVCYDGEDSYLVVAADKGTSAFSDIANGVAAGYGFWLGDGFASGGSQGYDHKKMGITARGVWESVKLHFCGLGTDIQGQDFTVVGIGDMSGDVFGNGMLLSRHIRLVAAFDHRHVFLDPDPDPDVSFAERRRLYGLPRSDWTDYDPALISTGGGVYPRSAKSIRISGQVKRALAVDADELAPDDLIRAVLRAPVDLLFNGGIGTYVKASSQTHTDAGDKANNAVRVDAADLRCRVIGEGGNLGFTQAGRVEFALAGGRIYTDAVHNVAGVTTSDYEVNLKILFSSLVAVRSITVEERNELLAQMAGGVAERVLYASFRQAQAMSITLAQAPRLADVHARLISSLEELAGLDRDAEDLPDELTIARRKADHRGLVAPELAIVIAFAKNWLGAELLAADFLDEACAAEELGRYFPPALRHRFRDAILRHSLRREILATEIAGEIVDRAGPSFALRLIEETGADVALLARAYLIARETFNLHAYWAQVEGLENQIDERTRIKLLLESEQLIEQACRWLIRANPDQVSATVRSFLPAANLLAESLRELLNPDDRDQFDMDASELRHAGVPATLAARASAMRWLAAALDITAAEPAAGALHELDVLRRAQARIAAVHFGLTARLDLGWLLARIDQLPRATKTQERARAALRADLEAARGALLVQALSATESDADGQRTLNIWGQCNAAAITRYVATLNEVRSAEIADVSLMTVAIHELENLLAERP
jgi:glutamate dehydrogenase